jgi:hypothetical protein
MVSGYAVIEDGVVTNMALAEEDFAAEQGWVLPTEGVTIGWLYADGVFSSPPEPAPPSREVQSAARDAAYREESDPIFFKAQRGEATMDEWLALVAEIKTRYPYP